MNKTCTKCRQTKPIEEFGIDTSKKDGRYPRCKICHREDNREAYVDLPKDKKESRQSRIKQWVNNNRARVNALNKNWVSAHVYIKSAMVRRWQNLNPQKTKEYKKNHNTKHPDQFRAHNALGWAVRSGKIPAANSFVCSACKTKQAQDYHHHMGYAKEHWLDVIPLCRTCHRKIDSHRVS